MSTSNGKPNSEPLASKASADHSPESSDTQTDYVTGVAYPTPFDGYILKMCQSATRYLCIQSPTLDHRAFDSQVLADAISALASTSRQTQVRILVSDTSAIVSKGHRLLQLARRMPSAVHIQVLKEHPEWNGETIVLRDRNGVLYKPRGSDEQAFYEPDSRASTRRHLELFEDLWRYSAADPELRSLSL